MNSIYIDEDLSVMFALKSCFYLAMSLNLKIITLLSRV